MQFRLTTSSIPPSLTVMQGQHYRDDSYPASEETEFLTKSDKGGNVRITEARAHTYMYLC